MGLLKNSTSDSAISKFWKCFSNTMEINKRGDNGKR